MAVEKEEDDETTKASLFSSSQQNLARPSVSSIRLFVDAPMRIAARIRLQRVGPAHRPLYDIVVSPTRRPRRVETLGQYDPIPRETRLKAKSLLDDIEYRLEKRVEWNEDRMRHWLSNGAKPSSAVLTLLRKVGLLTTRTVFRIA
jgi:small subunit ribosomal protein S16